MTNGKRIIRWSLALGLAGCDGLGVDDGPLKNYAGEDVVAATGTATSTPKSRCPTSVTPQICRENTACRATAALRKKCGAVLATEANFKRIVDARALPPEAKALPRTMACRPNSRKYRADCKDAPHQAYVRRNARVTGTTATARNQSAWMTGYRRPEEIGRALPAKWVFHRNPDWNANGERIESCDEYVYEKSYDWSRFMDVTSQCKGDPRCVIEVAYTTIYGADAPPRIAGRTLRRKDGRAMTPQITLKRGVFAKNAFFDGARKGLGDMRALPSLQTMVDRLPTVFPAKASDMRQLAQILRSGMAWAKIGRTGSATLNFADEWEYHRRHAELTQSVEDVVFADAEKRRGAFQKKIEEAGSCPSIRIPPIRLGDRVVTPPPRCAEPKTAADADPSSPQPKLRCAGPICGATNLLIDEFYRFKDGEGGCLGLLNFECDWSPKAFVDRFVTRGLDIKEQQEAFNRCERWLGNPTNDDKKDIASLEQYFAREQQRYEEQLVLLKDVPRLPGSIDSQMKFGQAWSAEESWGGDDFAAGYNASAGWYLSGKVEGANGGPYNVCKLEGGAAARFTAWGKAPVLGTVDVVDTATELQVNKDGNKKGRLKSHLQLIGTTDIYRIPDRASGREWEEIDLYHVFDNPVFSGKVPSPHFTFSVPTPIGPINLDLWVELRYSGKLSATAGMPSQCGTLAVRAGQIGREGQAAGLFEASAAFTPTANVAGKLALTWGIPGIANIGLEGSLTFIEASLPMTAKVAMGAKARGAGTGFVPYIRFNEKADLELRTLGGHVNLVIELLFIDLVDTEVFSWRGLGPWTIPLFKVASQPIELDVFGGR